MSMVIKAWRGHAARSTPNCASCDDAALGGAAEDPWIVAGITGLPAGVQCADFGPQRDYAALIATGAAVAGRAPRFAWRFWDAAVGGARRDRGGRLPIGRDL
jgi:hypothetical protein